MYKYYRSNQSYYVQLTHSLWWALKLTLYNKNKKFNSIAIQVGDLPKEDWEGEEWVITEYFALEIITSQVQ